MSNRSSNKSRRAGNTPPYKYPKFSPAKRVKDLLSRMTLEKSRANNVRPAGKSPESGGCRWRLSQRGGGTRFL
jgi:hypothetical protein